MSTLHRRYGNLRPANAEVEELKRELETLKAIYARDMQNISADIQTLSEQITSVAPSGV